MIDHTLTHDKPGADLMMSPRARNHTTNHEKHISVPDWIWKILTTIMLAVIIGGGGYTFTRVVDNQSDIKALRVSLQATVDASKIVDDQQGQHLIILAQQYDKLLDRIDGLRQDVQSIRKAMP